MKFIANENIPFEVVINLRKAGYNLIRIDEIKKGLSDDEVIKLTNKENGILITFDKDFGELVFKKRMLVGGIILIRIKPKNISYIFDRILYLLNSNIEIKRNFIVLEEDKIRIKQIKFKEV